MVVHLLVPTADRAQMASAAVRGSEPRVGFVVSKAVGPAVTRNLVKRRLRHLARTRVADLPSSAMLVVRALPASATASYADLERELDRCLQAVDVTVSSTAGGAAAHGGPVMMGRGESRSPAGTATGTRGEVG